MLGLGLVKRAGWWQARGGAGRKTNRLARTFLFTTWLRKKEKEKMSRKEKAEYTHPSYIIFTGIGLAWPGSLRLEAKFAPATSVFTLEEFTRERNLAPQA